jgi:nucleotide-binding universal stress UspA family protein
VRERLRRAGEALVEKLCTRLRAAGKNVCSEVREGNAAAEITKLAEECRADLIIAGARGVSLIEGLVVGSVADRLLKSGATSVLLVHRESGETR